MPTARISRAAECDAVDGARAQPPRAEPRAARPPAPAGARPARRVVDDRAPRRDAGAGAAVAAHRALDPARGLRPGRARRAPHRPPVVRGWLMRPRSHVAAADDYVALPRAVRSRSAGARCSASSGATWRASTSTSCAARARAVVEAEPLGLRRDRQGASAERWPGRRPADARLRRRLPGADGPAPAARALGRPQAAAAHHRRGVARPSRSTQTRTPRRSPSATSPPSAPRPRPTSAPGRG